MSLKPLIKVSNLPSDTYLPNTPTYTPAEAAKIKRFIPKFLSLVGVDHHGDPQEKKQQLQKEKLKVKAVQGRDVVLDEELKFIKQKDITVKIWDNVAVCVNIPFNNRQNAEDQKEQLDSKIEFYIENQLYFVDKNGEQISQSNKQLFSVNDIQVFFHPADLNAESFDNSYRQVRLSLAIGAIIPRKQTYGVQQLQECIKNDLVNSLKIMIRNKLPIRILRAAISKEKVLILQSFVAKGEDIEGQSKKLEQLLNKPFGNQNNQEQRLVESQQQGNNGQAIPRNQLSNRQLMLILLGLFFIYLFLKINPIDRILSEPL